MLSRVAASSRTSPVPLNLSVNRRSKSGVRAKTCERELDEHRPLARLHYPRCDGCISCLEKFTERFLDVRPHVVDDVGMLARPVAERRHVDGVEVLQRRNVLGLLDVWLGCVSPCDPDWSLPDRITRLGREAADQSGGKEVLARHGDQGCQPLHSCPHPWLCGRQRVA